MGFNLNNNPMGFHTQTQVKIRVVGTRLFDRFSMNKAAIKLYRCTQAFKQLHVFQMTEIHTSKVHSNFCRTWQCRSNVERIRSCPIRIYYSKDFRRILKSSKRNENHTQSETSGFIMSDLVNDRKFVFSAAGPCRRCSQRNKRYLEATVSFDNNILDQYNPKSSTIWAKWWIPWELTCVSLWCTSPLLRISSFLFLPWPKTKKINELRSSCCTQSHK